MKCNNCGFEELNDFAFCPKCGANQNAAPQSDAAPAQEAAPAPESVPVYGNAPEASAPRYYNGGIQQGIPSSVGSVTDRILAALKDSLFLILCIAYSASTVFGLFDGNISVIGILMTIFLWLTFASAQKGIASRDNLRCISGTVFASYVVEYVIAGALAFVGILAMIFGTSGSGFIDSIIQYIYDKAEVGFYNDFIGGFAAGIAVLIGFVLIIIAAATVVINYFAMRSIHLFAQSVYMNIGEQKACIVKANVARVWLMVFGIISAIGALSSLFGDEAVAFVASGSGAAAEIVGSIMIGKYFGSGN